MSDIKVQHETREVPFDLPDDVRQAAGVIAKWLYEDHADVARAPNFVERTILWPDGGVRLSVAYVKVGGMSPVEMIEELTGGESHV